MARETNLSDDPNLSEDLAVLAEEDRKRLGEAPTTEQLIAYRDGQLTWDQAERVRERLVVDPELAAIYLDLKRFPDLETTAAEAVASEAALEGAWRKLSAKLDQDVPITEDVEEEGQVLALRRRRPRPALLALAATLILAVGLGWFSVERRLSVERPKPLLEAPLPKGVYHQVYIDDTLYRGARLPVPSQAVGVAFRLDTTRLESPGSFVVELLDASNQRIRQQQEDLEVDQRMIVFHVPSSSLEDGRTYRLTVRPATALPDDPPAVEAVFTVAFGDFELSESRQALPVSCDDLDSEIGGAINLRKQGDREAAGTLYTTILDQAIESRCPHQETRARNGLGALATLEGRLVDSLRIFDRALSSLRASKPTRSDDPSFAAKAAQLEAAIELNRGSALFRLGQLDDAADAHRRVRSLYGRYEVGPQQWAWVLLQACRIHRLRGETEEAEEAAREALEKLGDEDPKTRASLWQELAWLDLENDRFDVAERALEAAFEALESTSDEIARANLLADRAEQAAQRGRWAECLEDAEEALRSRAAAGTPDLHLETHARYLRSLALWEMGNKEPARLASARGLALLEALHSGWQELGLPFFARRQRYFRHRLDVAASIEDPEQAWSVFESYRARGLLESSGLRARRSSAPDPALQQEWKDRVDELVEAISALDRWDRSDDESVLEHREARFRKRRLDLRELREEIFPAWGSKGSHEVGSEAVSEMLDHETLALTFAEGQRNLYVFAVDRVRGLELHTLDVTGSQVESLVGKLLQRLHPSASLDSRSGLDADVEALSERLLFPLGDRLDGVRRLVIVADTSLERLPFEVLRHPRTRKGLIESHEIVYLPSFSFLLASDARNGACRRPARTLLALGDPVFGPSDPRWPAGTPGLRNADDRLAWGPLAASASEVKTLARLYTSATTTALGVDATRKRFLAEAPKHRVLHVASHARSHSEVPERSRVALSCIDARGQVLETCDLYFVDAVNLELCGQVVVLSACGSADGRSVDGEGILGLPWAFLHAGASMVVASLWQVADEHTAKLISAFHRHLSQGAGPAEALRRAKQERIRAGAPPSAWAPFVAVGNWRIDI